MPQQDPKKTAQSIVDALPGNSLASKIGILSAGTALSVAAISNELYVINEESIVMFSLLTVFYGVIAYGGPMYNEWAKGQQEKMMGILNAARRDHESAVKQRMENVKDLSPIVEITKNLFEVSKVWRSLPNVRAKTARKLTESSQETARVEAQTYELEQKTALAAEAKSVLDSWVRYEGQVKARQQRELAETVIAKIEKELEDPKTLKKILDQSVADIERIVAQKQ